MIYLLAIPLFLLMYFIIGFINPCSRGLITKVALVEIKSRNSKKKYILKKFKQPVLKQYYYDNNLDFVTSSVPKCDSIYIISKDGTVYKYKYRQQLMVKATTNEIIELIQSTPNNYMDLYNNFSMNKFISSIAESLEDPNEDQI